jgi:flagellar motor component MotA
MKGAKNGDSHHFLVIYCLAMYNMVGLKRRLNMNRKGFIVEYTRFIQLAMKLAKKAKGKGIGSLEDEVEDIDGIINEPFKKGLYLIIDKTEPAKVDEIMSTMVEQEKDKHTRLYKTITKRTVLGIQEGLDDHALYKVISSFIELTPKEEDQIALLFSSDGNDHKGKK